MQQLVITAVGQDRPGLVDQFAGYLHEAGANVADSRMVNLRGQFSLMMLIEAEDAVIEAIQKDAVKQGEAIGLAVTASAPSVAGKRADGLPFSIKVFAMDQPGLVHRFTHLLHQHQVNIEELQTKLEPGSVSGTPLFTMELQMTVPTNVPVKKLRQELEELCDSLNCDADWHAGPRD